MTDMPKSLAIAGAWGYIGRKFLDVALRQRIRTFVYDPGPLPADIAPDALSRLADEAEFYGLPADLFHLAAHPEHRRNGQRLLLERARHEPVTILNEKPMAAPESPEDCDRLVAAARDSGVCMLYDFPELYDPLTERVLERLNACRDVRITHISLCRSKDREAPENPRNYKRMVPIQYQEAVHCLAYVLFILARLRGSLAELFAGGVTIRADAEPYVPPNPGAYPYVVDGRCRYEIALAGLRIQGLTDFKSGAAFTKRRVLTGTAAGRPFRVEAEYLEGRKQLILDGVDQQADPRGNSYEAVLRTYIRWRRDVGRDELLRGIYPHPAFARITYQLSSALWRASHDGSPLRFADLDGPLQFDAGFREALPHLPKYA